jgi:hypothetical protein
MNVSVFAQYFPGIVFLFLVNVAVAVPFALLVRNKLIAVLLSVAVTTLVLKARAYVEIGYFDLSFLLILLIIGLFASALVSVVADMIRGHFA